MSAEEIKRGIVVRTPYIVISISDPGTRRPRVRRPTALRDVLYVQFHDMEPDDGLGPRAGLVPMTRDNARAIWDFVLRYRDHVETIVVHCEQGMSRSPAVAAAICRALGGDDGQFFQQYSPNQYVYGLLLETIPEEPPEAVG